MFERYHSIYGSRGSLAEVWIDKDAKLVKKYYKINGNTIPNHLRLVPGILVTNNLGITEHMNVQQLMKNKLNKFLGWECQVGKDFIDINFQTISRSVCGVTGPSGHVDDLRYNFSNNAVICNKVTCECFHDLLTTKTKL